MFLWAVGLHYSPHTRRHGLDPLWLWCRPVAVAPIQPLAWEPPCAMVAALKKKKQSSSISFKLFVYLF